MEEAQMCVAGSVELPCPPWAPLSQLLYVLSHLEVFYSHLPSASPLPSQRSVGGPTHSLITCLFGDQLHSKAT
jgi:hypothetical protein